MNKNLVRRIKFRLYRKLSSEGHRLLSEFLPELNSEIMDEFNQIVDRLEDEVQKDLREERNQQ